MTFGLWRLTDGFRFGHPDIENPITITDDQMQLLILWAEKLRDGVKGRDYSEPLGICRTCGSSLIND